jgi:hypothetical protein
LAFPRYYSGEDEAKRTPILAFKSNGQPALEWDSLSAPKRGSDAFLVQLLFIERLSAQPKAIDFAVAVHRLTSLRRVIFPFVRPLDQGKMIAASRGFIVHYAAGE